MTKSTSPKPTAYSYVRFSSPEQAKGDSLRRQTELRDAWLKRSGAVLDTTLSLRDEGISGFTGKHRDNPDRHALAAFLSLVERGRIPKGSFLVVESLDRLSREHIRPALSLLLSLIDAGIRVVQLLPVETIYDENVEPMTLMMALMELSRGHSESAMKSQRLGAAWREKKRKASKEGKPVTARLPLWLKLNGDKIELDKPKAAIVARVFRMAIDGHGIGAITKRLNIEKVRPFGKADCWPRSYVAKILSNPATFGTYQPFSGRGGSRKPDGEPIPNYFPAAIDEQTFHAARAALTSRKLAGGRPSRQTINIFRGLLRHAIDGSPISIRDKGARASGLQLVSSRAENGAAAVVSFPAVPFERAILSQLRELDPREILPESSDDVGRVLALTGRLDETEGRITKIQAKLIDGGELDSLVEVLRQLEAQRRTLAAELSEAKQAAASPLADAWGETRSILELLDSADDQTETRVRLRAALRRIIADGRVIFVARGSLRLAVCQLWFVGGRHRDYLILHQPKHGNADSRRDATTQVRSFVAADGPLDLRKKSDAKKLADALKTIDIDEFR